MGNDDEKEKKEVKKKPGADYLKHRVALLHQQISARCTQLDTLERQAEIETEAIARLRGGVAELMRAIEVQQAEAKKAKKG